MIKLTPICAVAEVMVAVSGSLHASIGAGMGSPRWTREHPTGQSVTMSITHEATKTYTKRTFHCRHLDRWVWCSGRGGADADNSSTVVLLSI